MIAAFILGLLPEGEALYTDTATPLENQKQAAMEWLQHYDLVSVHAIVGGTITDISAAFCRMWINKADLSGIDREDDFPALVRSHVPELVAEVMRDRAENERAERQLRSDYRASAL